MFPISSLIYCFRLCFLVFSDCNEVTLLSCFRILTGGCSFGTGAGSVCFDSSCSIYFCFLEISFFIYCLCFSYSNSRYRFENSFESITLVLGTLSSPDLTIGMRIFESRSSVASQLWSSSSMLIKFRIDEESLIFETSSLYVFEFLRWFVYWSD